MTYDAPDTQHTPPPSYIILTPKTNILTVLVPRQEQTFCFLTFSTLRFFEIWPFRGGTPTLEATVSSESLQFSWYFDTKHADSRHFTGIRNGHITSKYGDHVIWPGTI